MLCTRNVEENTKYVQIFFSYKAIFIYTDLKYDNRQEITPIDFKKFSKILCNRNRFYILIISCYLTLVLFGKILMLLRVLKLIQYSVFRSTGYFE